MRSAGGVPALPKCMTALLHLCLGRFLWVGHSQRRERRDRPVNQSWINELSKDLEVYVFTKMKQNARVSDEIKLCPHSHSHYN